MIEAKWLFQYIYNQQVYPIQRLWKGIYIYESASSRNLSNVKTAEHIRPRMSRSLYENMVPDRKLGDTIFCLMGEEKEAFLDLIKGMLLWHPDMRKRQTHWRSILFPTRANKCLTLRALSNGMTRNHF
ncbi:hypothetical protein N7491_009470 [Penicillium cf. griseofulvum]|nr:hypothetical protein N7491_009470 [Penicillium cf. griseofulvum]